MTSSSRTHVADAAAAGHRTSVVAVVVAVVVADVVADVVAADVFALVVCGAVTLVAPATVAHRL